MNAWQKWLDEKCVDLITWLWSWVSITAYWVCAIGMVSAFLLFVTTKNKKDLHWCIKFILIYLLIVAVKLGCGY